MVKFLILLAMIGPNTEILVVSESCGPCIEAVQIVTQLQYEGYDVVIVDISSNLARTFKVRMTPTLVVRPQNRKVIGLQSESKYRELISQ